LFLLQESEPDRDFNVGFRGAAHLFNSPVTFSVTKSESRRSDAATDSPVACRSLTDPCCADCLHQPL
jgi:hypothetical protein